MGKNFINMHEASVCRNIVSTIEDEMEYESLEKIREIHIKVGVLSCIEPGALQQAFTFIKTGTPFQNSELYIDLVEVTAQCEECGEKFKVDKYKFVCPKCEAPVSNIMEGQELLIHKIILEESPYAETN